MGKRPHSRNRRYTGSSGSFSRRTSSKGFSGGGRPMRGFGFPSRGMRGGNGVSTPLVLLIAVVMYLFTSFGSNFLEDAIGDYNSNSGTSGSYIDTSTSELNYNVDKHARDKYTVLEDVEDVTVMIYMCGSDLESNYGMATSDLNEMLYAEIEDNINVIVETGGAKKWQNNVMSSRYLQRYQVTSQGLKVLDDSMKNAPMTQASTLTDFINYSKKNFPAERYILVMWDHGGGSVSGYGYDENYANYGSMSIDEIQSAIAKSGVKFDIIGFDACLMATLETAIALEPYADYLIASEETEPGTGWYYTNWLKELDRNPQIDSRELAKTLIDDYIRTSKSSSSSQLTLSLTDLAELKGTLGSSLASFANNIQTKLKSDDYQVVADARATSREFSSSSQLDQVDLVDFALKLNTTESKELASVIQSAVKYNRCYNMTNSYGLSVYFPYSSLSKMNSMVEIYENIDMDESYSDAMKTFATMRSSGQIVASNTSSSTTSILDTLMGQSYTSTNLSSSDILSLLYSAMNSNGSSSYASLLGGNDWVDTSLFETMSDYIGRNQVTTSNLTLTQKDGQTVLALSEEEWELMKTIELNVFVDDGEGFFELGMDNVFDYNRDGDLIIDYDDSWLSIDDQFVSYYLVSDEYVDEDNYTIIGRVPAYLNDERVDIMLRFDDENPYGVVDGARRVYEDETDTSAKGLIEINQGDRIDFICNYHDYDGNVEEVYLGNTLVVDDELYIANKYIDHQEATYSYRLTDIYGNHYWTPTTK